MYMHGYIDIWNVTADLQYCGVRWIPTAHKIPYFVIVFLVVNIRLCIILKYSEIILQDKNMVHLTPLLRKSKSLYSHAPKNVRTLSVFYKQKPTVVEYVLRTRSLQ
uniref:Uncharacterized protein n=1 Tax=Ciona intestinalis TaxID=7719 RepID=H2Y2Y7_CIOIN